MKMGKKFSVRKIFYFVENFYFYACIIDIRLRAKRYNNQQRIGKNNTVKHSHPLHIQ